MAVRRKGGEDCAMATELYDAAVLMQEVLNRVEARLRRILMCDPPPLEDLSHAANLEIGIRELLKGVLDLADIDTNVKLRALTKGNRELESAEFEPKEAHEGKRISTLTLSFGRLGKRPEFKSEEAQAGKRSIGFKGRREETQSLIDRTFLELEKSTMGEPVELLLQQARADSEIGDKFKKMLLSVYKSEARSMEEPKKGNFELGSISFLFNQMWDHVRQLQLVSTDATFLATSMLTHNMLADHVSALQLCSQDIDWLCTWVPEFAERLQRIEKDDGMDEMMMEGAEMEEALFAEYISSWERVRRRSNSISFEDSTTLSSMLFTHYMPGHHPLFADLTRTMQIFSIKITELEGFNWPLEVYGVVAARDAVDYRRNTLFVRNRDNCQLLKEEDCFLHLTGPSRAVVSTDTVHIEIQLKVKGTKKSEDRSLITEAFACAGDSADTFITHSIDGCFCKIKLTCEHFRNSIQATIVSIRVTGGSPLPANHVQVVCSSLPEEDTKGKTERKTNYVLFDQKDVAVPVDEYGYLKLSRQVVPVQLKGKLEIVTKTGGMSGSVVFKPELSNISQNHCILGNCKLEMTVAWSFIVDAEQDMLMMSYTKPFMAPSTFPFMKLVEDTEGGSC